MTETEHLLSCLAEECAEVAHEVSKALRFGLDNIYPEVPGGRTVRAKIKAESVDLIAVLQLLVEKKILEDGWDERLCQEKKEKIRDSWNTRGNAERSSEVPSRQLRRTLRRASADRVAPETREDRRRAAMPA
jgi:hypothetical protein